MTGYGQAEGTVGALRVQVDVRTVNHRFFSPSIKLPSAFATLGDRGARGHAPQGGARARHAHGAQRTARGTARRPSTRRALRPSPLQSALVDARPVGRRRSRQRAAHARRDVGAAGRRRSGDGGRAGGHRGHALDALQRSRARRDERLVAVLRSASTLIEPALDRASPRAPPSASWPPRPAARIGAGARRRRHRRRAAAGAGDRLLADRMDVAEELDRFRSHSWHSGPRSTTSGGEPVGKRLGFLLQEMLREANTTGSKAADAPILHEVVGAEGRAGTPPRAGRESRVSAFPVILSAPSGAEKPRLPPPAGAAPDLGYSVSCTTRAPREGEVDGRDYRFLDREAFRGRGGRRGSSPSGRRCTAISTARCGVRSSGCSDRSPCAHGHRCAGGAAVSRGVPGHGAHLRACRRRVRC
jgi:hypothetical protein